MLDNIVYKPWGKEVWIELNDKYCYKRIYINANHRTSFQYHQQKTETNYIIEGQAIVWLEDTNGNIKKDKMGPNQHFNVKPFQKHRIIAVTNLILQEVSTPEVDDVIRIEDDMNRSNGTLTYEHLKPAICILAAGKGQRIDKFVPNYHKGLLPLNNKAVISHIIDKVPDDHDVIIAVGFNRHLIMEYCKAAHTNRNIKFVSVDNIDGPGSGPGYSLHQCKSLLQRPFYISTVDCIFNNDLPLLDDNWLGVTPTNIPELYSTVKVDSTSNVVSFKNKDSGGYDEAFIGICGIYDFKTFWNNLEKNLESGELVSAFYDVSAYKTIRAKQLEWFDIGTVDGYLDAGRHYNKKQYGIPKINKQFVYKVDNRFIKYDQDKSCVSNIIQRNTTLSKLVPKLVYAGENFYSYEWIDANTLYELNDFVVYTKFFEWCKTNMWQPEPNSLTKECELFYQAKTLNRLESFLKIKPKEYAQSFIINGMSCPTIDVLLGKIDWNKIHNPFCTKIYHGDLQFDNVLYQSDNNNYMLIDWRSDFGESVNYGDVYYDLAKLYGGMLMSFRDMKNDSNINIDVNLDQQHVSFSFKRNKELDRTKEYYEAWLLQNNYNLYKIKVLSAIILLNMAPLHSEIFSNLLFFQSMLKLHELHQ